jgi:hypothetical protein
VVGDGLVPQVRTASSMPVPVGFKCMYDAGNNTAKLASKDPNAFADYPDNPAGTGWTFNSPWLNGEIDDLCSRTSCKLMK